jgi:hypothetical protein
MGHYMSRCAPRRVADHALRLTMSVVAHDHRAPAHARLDWEAHAPTPSSSHERGTAGPEKGAMAVLDDAEATTYHMLQHVLQNG